ncbi:MAG: class I SAM-dependent RNA methyltransferase, partial [Clostridia bacterium]|nr:class I SAM-dependent RNA methyltransferase [Clostridia bacterium]
MQKNDSIRAVVDAIASGGEGIVKHDGVTFFVPACLPGEKIQFKVLKIKDKIGYGKLEEVFTPAEERVRAKCPVFLRCGGCALQHIDYPVQLLHKTAIVRESLRKIGGIVFNVPTTVKSDAPYGYRNKLQMPIGVNKEGETVIGFYAERSHRIVPVSSCSIHPEWAEKLIAIIKRYATECAVKGYDEETQTG